MIFRGDLGQAAFCFFVKREILDQINQLLFAAGASDQRLQRDDALFALGVDSFPVGKMFPACRHAADLGAGAVGEDDEGVVPEHLRNRVLVVFQVVLVGVLDLAVALLQFDKDERQAVDEADQIGPAFVDTTGR